MHALTRNRFHTANGGTQSGRLLICEMVRPLIASQFVFSEVSSCGLRSSSSLLWRSVSARIGYSGTAVLLTWRQLKSDSKSFGSAGVISLALPHESLWSGWRIHATARLMPNLLLELTAKPTAQCALHPA